MQDKIIIKGAREHNLKNVSLEIPRNKLTVFTGLSGSGKSSLAFDTIFAEGQRRYVESLSAYARQFLGQMDKPDIDEIEGLSPAISIDQKAHSANPRSTVATITEIYDYLRVLFARVGKPHCPICGKEIRKMTVEEMVDLILKKTAEIHQEKNIENQSQKFSDQIIVLAPVVRGRKGEYYQLLYDLYNDGFSEVRVNGKFKLLREKIILSRYKQHTIDLVVDKVTLGWPIENNRGLRARLAEATESALKYGQDVVTVILDNGKEMTMSSKFSCPEDEFSFPEIEPRLFSFNSPYGACQTCHGLGTEFLFSENPCPDCHGDRLRKESLHVFIAGKNIVDVTKMSIKEAHNFFAALAGEEKYKMQNTKCKITEQNLKLSENDFKVAETVLKEITSRLGFMLDVGLGYLTLNRTAGTLSGGEAQRIRLASQVGSRLVGATYILDEPTIGLHPKDNEKLLTTLKNIRDIGNTVIVVEHDPETIWMADYLVDLGPGAGTHGGEIVATGPIPDILQNQKSLTAAYLRGDKRIRMPEKRRPIDGKSKYFSSGQIKIVGATENNLKNIDIRIPLKRFVCVTGVSGSGKSTLVNEILWKALSNKLNHTNYQVGKHARIEGLDYLDKVIVIDQSPIGRTPRSNPVTYTGAWTYIRDLFASLPESRARGYQAGRFSFNVPSDRGGGRCENCEGGGMIKIEMHFLPAVYVTCPVCKGTRFDRETLTIQYKGKNIHEVLQMTVEEAEEFFKNIPPVKDRLKILREVGLQYLTLGQSATTLSGGEAQRIKLGAELSRRASGRTIYILDEPTVGLHYADVEKLLEVLHRLVNLGNTIVVIEHNLDFIKTADWIIDLGPDGGDAGGYLLAAGTPEELAKNQKSYTGQYLKKIMK